MPSEGRQVADAVRRSPMERWGTCCPSDPHCEHSFLESEDLFRWMNRAISDDEARQFDGPGAGESMAP